MSIRFFVCLMMSLLLAGCGGGGGGTSMSPHAAYPSPSSTAGATKNAQRVAIHLKIAETPTASSNARKTQYVSPATSGVLVQVYASPQSANPTAIGTSATDVSPGSSSCAGATGTRTCTIYIPAPPGTDDFVFTTYDQAPAAGTTTFSANANILSIGKVTQTINLGVTNVVNVSLGGVIASLTTTPVSESAAAGAASTYTLAITAADADGYAIIAGSTDPYNNPIAVTVTETGGTNVTSLTLGGASGSGTSSVQMTQSTQTVTVLYSGGGAPGYSAQIAVAASGIPTQTTTFTPLYLTSGSPYYAAGALSFTAPAQTANLNLAEAGFRGTFVATASGCANVASVSAPVAGPTSSVTVTAGTSAGTCTITFSDGNIVVPVAVQAQYTSSTITIPVQHGVIHMVPVVGAATTTFAIASDGTNIWFTEQPDCCSSGYQVGEYKPSTQQFSYWNLPQNGSRGEAQIAYGYDGGMWFPEYSPNSAIGEVLNGSYLALSSAEAPTGIAQGSINYYGAYVQAMWYTTNTSTLGIYALNGTSYTQSTFYGPATGPVPLYTSGLTVGPDGNMWVAEDGNGSSGWAIGVYYLAQRYGCGIFSCGYSMALYRSQDILLASEPHSVALGPDGAVWITEYDTDSAYLGRIDANYNKTEIPFDQQNRGNPANITRGSDGAMWFTSSFSLGRISTDGRYSVTYYPLPSGTASSPNGITAGPNGSVWFTAGNQLGYIYP